MNIINKKSSFFLEQYLNTPSPSGYESQGQTIWINYLKNYVNNIQVDIYGTAYGIINPNSEFKVIIEAHADEISWSINYIDDNGLIYVIRNGGSDHMIAPSKRVHIHTKKGIINGVFGWPAIHTRNHGKEEVPKIEELWIDCGIDTKEKLEELGVHIGCVVTYSDLFMKMNNYFISRALDNKIGGFIIAEVARLIKENNIKLDFSLYIVNSVQEEIGLRGAEMITETIKPNIAIITDVTHDTCTPMINKKKEGNQQCGKGPVITYAPAVHHNLRNLIINTAIEQQIPFQRSASNRFTGTDTDAFAYSNGGVASALISLPLRYMHTTVEMVNKNDVENVIKLIYQSVLKINKNYDFYYLKI